MSLEILHTWTFWIIAAVIVGAGLFGVKRYIPILNGMKRGTAALAVLLVGFLVMGGGGSMFSVTNDETTTGQLQVLLSDAAQVNTSTTDDYYNTAKNVVTLYFDDSDIADDGYVNVTAVIYRTNVADAATVRTTCTAPDMTLSGVTQTSLVSDSAGLAELYVSNAANSGGIQKDANTVYYDSSFAVGTNTATVYVSFKQDETWEDAMTPYQTTYTISCDSNGTPFQIVNIARD